MTNKKIWDLFELSRGSGIGFGAKVWGSGLGLRLIYHADAKSVRVHGGY